MRNRCLFLLSFLCLLASAAYALTADQVMKKSQDWFKSGKAWSLKLELAGIKFYSDGESMWQHNVEQKQVLIKAVEDLSSSLHPSELLFKYLNCKALSVGEGAFGGQKLWVLKLDPSKYKGQFTKMEVWLSQKDFSPVRLFTVDPSGNSSWYNIVNLKVMKNVSVDDFRYKALSGVDEIDMR